jgi:hypothetical protein
MAPRSPDPAPDRALALADRDVPPEFRAGPVRRRILRWLGIEFPDPRRERRLREELARARHAERLLLRVHDAAERAHDDWAADEPMDEAMADLRSELRTAAELRP